MLKVLLFSSMAAGFHRPAKNEGWYLQGKAMQQLFAAVPTEYFSLNLKVLCLKVLLWLVSHRTASRFTLRYLKIAAAAAFLKVFSGQPKGWLVSLNFS